MIFLDEFEIKKIISSQMISRTFIYRTYHLLLNFNEKIRKVALIMNKVKIVNAKF